MHEPKLAEHAKPAHAKDRPGAVTTEPVGLAQIGNWMFESSPDCVTLLDAQGRLVRMNRNGQALLSIDSFDDLAGTPWYGLWPAQARNTIEAALAAARRGESFQFQAQCATRGGVAKWWDVTMSGVKHGQEIAFTLVVARDITATVEAIADAQRAREEAEEARRAKSRFIANIGEQVRSPLNAAIGFAQILAGAGLPPAQRGHAERIAQAAQQLLALMNDLVDLSRVETGRLTLNNRDFDLQDVLDRVLATSGESARGKGVALTVSNDSDVSRLFGDPARLCQILLNYVAAALRWTGKGTVALRVQVVERGDESALLRFEVTDSGRGLTPAEARMLFSDFSESDGSSASSGAASGAGRGLGLAMCKRLAQLMGGEVGVDSQPGLGSKLWFTARMRERDACGTALAEFSEPPAVLRGKRVLVVDDDPVSRDVAQQLLELAGAQVELAENGLIGVERATRQDFDAVLMDLLMPVMGGIDATRALREDRATRYLPVIAMTATPTDADRKASSRAGANDFIGKPLDTGKLWSVMAYWTSRPRATVPTTEPAGSGDEFYSATIPAPLGL